MTSLIGEYVNRVEYDSYEDFAENFKFEIPENFNFGFDIVDKYAEISPNKKALIWCDDNEEKVFTFKDIKEESNKVANFLKSIGIKKGDAVLLTLKNRYEWWYTMVALHKIGAIAISATHMLRLHDIKYRLNSADIKAIITIDEDNLIGDYMTAEKELGMNIHKILVRDEDSEGWYNFHKEIAKQYDTFKRPKGKEATTIHDPLVMYFSSGTSGEPKMIKHNCAYPIGDIVTAKYWHEVVEDGIHHTTADTGWIKAVWGNLYGQWICGAAVFIYDYVRFNALDLIKKITEHHVNTFCAPPTIYRFLIKEDLSDIDFSSIKHASTAGESLPPEVFNKFKEKTGLEIKEAFGQTETVISIGTFKWLKPKLGSVGRPNPAFKIKLLDENDKPVEIGEEGEICFDLNRENIGLFDEYYHDPKRNHEKRYDGYYHCGDKAWIDEDGYYHFVGRNDDVIKSSGYRIGPYEVESAVISHPAVVECAITGYPHEIRGQLVKATIVLANGYEPSDELVKDIQNHVKKVTAPYKYPRMIEFVDELPKTVNGKIIRKKIREDDLKKYKAEQEAKNQES
ncbi:acetyl-CoA synthetase [Methanobrevibacter sp. 87.7]|uniref:AMP-binding protein n=1 Tax=Methanobrevibacter sp. 87.7 TaxID=387957 RepID=UPI000B50D553|nr:AMP-binding protein [Methanobrevibacter sp. 87.7]OWT32645.1 acetyl-CoA synthetase [Methanobrevibacter sp. 87.7]